MAIGAVEINWDNLFEENTESPPPVNH